MADWILNTATIAAVTLQLGVMTVFFGSLVFMTLLGFSIVPAPY